MQEVPGCGQRWESRRNGVRLGSATEAAGAKEKEKEHKTVRWREEEREKHCQRVSWNDVGERRIRRKQAAIVSDDSLVATHLTSSRISVNHPLSMFLSFALSALLTVVASRYQLAWLTTSLPTSLPHCDNLLARSETVKHILRLSLSPLFLSSLPPLLPLPLLPPSFYLRSVQSCIPVQRNYRYLHNSTIAAPLGISLQFRYVSTEKFDKYKKKEKEEESKDGERGKEEGSERENKTMKCYGS